MNDPFSKVDGASGVTVVRPLLGAAQAAADRLASEIRALGDSLPEPSAGTVRESLRALHAALGRLHEVHGGSIPPTPRVRVDPLRVVCEVAEAAQFEGVEVEVEARGAAGELDVDEGELRRLLRWLVERATPSTSGAVGVGVVGELAEVTVSLPWHDEFAEGVSAPEHAWLERAADALGARLGFGEGRVRLILPREFAVSQGASLGDLARELDELRRERLSQAQEVERATCALHSAQLEAEAARRQLLRVERSTLRAVGDLQQTFESLEAMAGLVVESDGIGRDLQTVSQSGMARVMELVAEVDTAAMASAHSVAPAWSDAPHASGIHAPRELLEIIEDEGYDDDPTPR
ncbi:MAG: hypothetical protein R3A48_00305 [Polyangiales bacterium]